MLPIDLSGKKAVVTGGSRGVGRAVARTEGPARFTVLDIGRDYVLGLRTDDLDVEHVEVYRITRR